MLRLKSLGHTLIEANDAHLAPTAETVFATALYLIIEAGRPIGREELTRLLWPGVSDAQAQHGLRQALYRLKTLGATIKADRKSITLSPRYCSTDFAPLLAPQSASALEEFADRIGGSFLPGYRPQLSEEFATWVERQRDVVHSAVARALVAGMQAKKRVSDWNSAEQLAGLCLSIDSLNEEATLTMAEAAALGGSKTKALAILNHYLSDIGEGASEIRLPATLLRRRISEAYRNNIFEKRDVPFVGREEEMAELTSALAKAQQSRGSVYLLWGEAGIGKTRLLSELARVAAFQHIHIARVGCQSHDVTRPFSAFVDLLPQLLSLPGALGCTPESMQFLRRLIAHNPGDESRTSDEIDVYALAHDRARGAFVDLLDAVSSETCCLLQIEDVHWIDPQSRWLIEALSNWLDTHRILLLISSRILDVAHERVFPIPLRRLRADASSLVAKALLNSHDAVDHDHLNWCISASGGNPYFLIELMRNNAHQGTAHRVPTSLGRLLQSRVRMLSCESRRLLETCCILGAHSTTSRIEECIDYSRTSLLQALDELDSNGMIYLDDSRVLCRHDLLSTVVLAEMSSTVRAMLHRFVAKQLESEADISHSITLVWESAEHWLAAGDSTRAVELLRRCGNYLMDVGLPNEAAQVLARAASVSAQPNEKYRIGTERARALMRAEQIGDAVAAISEVLPLRDSLSPRPSPLDELGVLSFQARWEYGESIPTLVRECLAAMSTSSSASSQEKLTAARWLLVAADNLCDTVLGKRIYDSVVDQLNSSLVATDTRLWFEMVYNCTVGDGEHSLKLADDLAVYARGSCPPIVGMRYLRQAAHAHHCHGRAEDAINLFTESFQIAEVLGSKKAMVGGASHVGSLYMRIGDIESADVWLARAAAAHSPGETDMLDTNTWSHWTELAIRVGDVERAESCFAHCRAAVIRFDSARSNARALSLETQIAVLKGNQLDNEAIRQFMALFAVIKSTTLQDFTAESLLVGLRSLRREQEARDLAAEFLMRSRRDRSIPSAYLLRIVSEIS